MFGLYIWHGDFHSQGKRLPPSGRISDDDGRASAFFTLHPRRAVLTHAEALAALRLIVHRADRTVPNERGVKLVVFTEAQIAEAKAALEVVAK